MEGSFFEACSRIVGRWLSMLKQESRRSGRVAFVPRSQDHRLSLLSAYHKATAASLGIDSCRVHIETLRDMERLIERRAYARPAVSCSRRTFSPRRIAILSSRSRCGTVCRVQVYALRVVRGEQQADVLGVDQVILLRPGRYLCDRVLRGEKPADLRSRRRSSIETIINLGTAKRFGLTVPPGMLVAADEVVGSRLLTAGFGTFRTCGNLALRSRSVDGDMERGPTRLMRPTRTSDPDGFGHQQSLACCRLRQRSSTNDPNAVFC